MSVMKIPVVKAKGQYVEVETDKIPEAVYAEALSLGLKVLVNRGTSKLTKASCNGDEALLASEAMKKAAQQVEAINLGTIKFSGGKAKTKGAGALNTEAMRLAKNLVKDAMKAQKIKISTVKASDITAAARIILEGEQGPAIFEQAKQNLAERDSIKLTVDISTLVKADPKLVAKAEAEKKSKPLSAKQAGKTAPRAKKGKGAVAQPTA